MVRVMKKNQRKDFPPEIQLEILSKSHRICALCFYLEGDLTWKHGQLAHIDRDHTNIAGENAAYLCLRHHDDYDAKRGQAKNFLPAELKEFQNQLYKVFEEKDWRSIGSQTARPSRHKHHRSGITLEVYERRLPVYHATIAFLRDVVKDLKPQIPRIFQFVRETEEALFLYDDVIAQYLEEMSSKAFRLQAIEIRRSYMASDDREIEDFQSLVKAQVELWEWFNQQYEEARRLFLPFLRLS
jgi:hypothetical protein